MLQWMSASLAAEPYLTKHKVCSVQRALSQCPYQSLREAVSNNPSKASSTENQDKIHSVCERPPLIASHAWLHLNEDAGL